MNQKRSVRVGLSRVPRAAAPGVPPRALTVPGAELPRLLSHVEEEAASRLSQAEEEEATRPSQVEEEAAGLFTGRRGGGRRAPHRWRKRPPGPSQAEEGPPGPHRMRAPRMGKAARPRLR